MAYDFELDRIINFIKERKAKTVLIQLADGLKQYAEGICNVVESKADCTCIVSADPCYGFCDVAEDEAKRLGVDVIVHIGHSRSPQRFSIPVLFIEAYSKLDVGRAVIRAAEVAKEVGLKKVGLCVSVQHLKELPKAENILRERGLQVFVGEDPRGVLKRGQVIGCDVTTALSIADCVDGFIVISGGIFHALGVALFTGKRVIVADPYRGDAKDISSEVKRILAIRWYAISKLKDARKVGIVIGLKSGQMHLAQALKLKEALENTGKEVMLLALREITPEALIPYGGIEVFVIAACPRIPIDDYSNFHKPVLNIMEAYMYLQKYMGDYHKFYKTSAALLS